MTTEERIESLIKAMTLEEKVSLCSGADNWHTRRIERLGIPALRMTDGPHGVRTISDEDPSVTLPATYFPTGSALAATWNTELMERVGVALADETKAKGNHILLGPAVNIHRHPLGGRNFEYYSEDPYLAGRMAVAWIKGLQSQGVGASLKHFACNNSEFERLTISSEVDERTLHEMYYPAFKAAVTEAQPWTVMSSYNRINGVSSAHNKPMLTDLLKGEWGFTGFVVSDWGGVYDRVAAANAGCDLEMPYKGAFQAQELLDAVRKGLVSEEIINDKVRRILGIVARAGLFEGKTPQRRSTTNTPERQALAREAACEAITLLKNQNGVLPLDEKAISSLAVIGPAAEIALQGGGSARVNPYYSVSPLDGIKARAGQRIKVSYEQGCSLDGSYPALDMSLSAEYFDNPDLAGKPIAVRKETGVALAKETLPHAELANADFSVRWTGKLNVKEAGIYRFSLFALGRARVLVDGKQVVSNGNALYPKAFTPMLLPVTGGVRLASGGEHSLVIEYSRHDEPQYSIKVGLTRPSDDPIARAVQLASRCDAAIVCIGLPDRYESEGYDRPDIELTGDQVELVRRVAAANPRTVVVLQCGNPVNMSRWIGRVPAVVEAWYAGQESGNAIAAVLFGDVNPSGKLPTTFPKRLHDTPAYINYPGEADKVRYGEGIFVGYRYYDAADVDPLFPFGHGLSYTTFRYGPLTITPRRMSSTDMLTVSLTVTNTGQRAGKDVVQLYVSDVESSLARPPKELKAFRKVDLQPGETKLVTFTLTRQDLAFYDPRRGRWVAEAGRFQILVGSSSRDIRSRGGFTYLGDPDVPVLSADSRVSEILSHSKGRAVMRKHLGALLKIGRLRWVASYTLNQLSRLAPENWPPDLLARIDADLRTLN